MFDDLLFCLFLDVFFVTYSLYAALGVCAFIEWWRENRRKRDVDG